MLSSHNKPRKIVTFANQRVEISWTDNNNAKLHLSSARKTPAHSYGNFPAQQYNKENESANKNISSHFYFRMLAYCSYDQKSR